MAYTAIIEAINAGRWTEAAGELKKALSENVFDGRLAVLAATVLTATGDIRQARRAVGAGLLLNHRDYELWLSLGQTYEGSNVNQAYLCYENALFYCDNRADAEVILRFMEPLRENAAFCVKKCAIVILSYQSLPYTRECIESIRATCPENAREIIVVDNASGDGSVRWLQEQSDIILQCNSDNVGFPAGCNQGIRLAGEDSDILLLNNDTVLPPNALFWLRMGLYENDRTGAAGSVSNSVSNFQQVEWSCGCKAEFLSEAVRNNLPMESPYEKRIYLVAFAMLIRRGALEETGYLDELFSPGTYEDMDMGLKLREKGWDVVLCRNSFIYHYGSGGGTNIQKWYDLDERNAAKLVDKWGVGLEYFSVRGNVLTRMQAAEKASLKVLEVNCGFGLTLLMARDSFPDAQVYGIEGNRKLWPLIPGDLDVCRMDPETGVLPWSKGYFDLIFVGGAFDTVSNQAAIVERYAEYLEEDGTLVIGDMDYGKREILSGRNEKQCPGIAACVFTYNHPETVAVVLEEMAFNYYLHGMDAYYYDSSEGDETKRVVETWIGRGYTNIYYVRVKGLSLGEKFIAVSKGEGLRRQYDYIWPMKDRTIWEHRTMDAVAEHIAECPDIMYLEVRDKNADREKSVYGDGISLYQRHSLGLTSVDTAIYRYSTVWGDTESMEAMMERMPGFPHFGLALTKLAEMERPRLCILQGKRVVLYDVPTTSRWAGRTFHVWKDLWIQANDRLPQCYQPYSGQIIKYVAGQSMMLGDVEKLWKLKEQGELTVDRLDEIAVNWERVSNIPFEEVRRIAEAEILEAEILEAEKPGTER